MAVLNINLFSRSLNRSVTLTAVVPTDMPHENLPDKFRTVYLLHGYCGNHMDWLLNAPLPELAAHHKIVFIIPDGENSFYLNDAIRNAMYEDFICKELPVLCRRLFHLSDKAEDTAVAGLSMGGFGAIHSGLAYPETFGNVIALSSALITDGVSKMKEGENNGIAPYSYYHHTFGAPESVLGSHNDPSALAKKLIEDKRKPPNIYMACGTEDFLLNSNRGFHNHLLDSAIKHTYVEDTGVHDWIFWKAYIQKALIWWNDLKNDN